MISIGKIIKTHGVRGEVKFYSYCEHLKELCKQQTVYLNENEVKIQKIIHIKNDVYIIQVSEISSINEALKVCGVEIFVENLVKKDGEFFENEAIGFEIFEDGSDICIGKVTQFHHFPNSKMLEIELQIPFERGNVAKNKLYVSRSDVISIEKGKIIIQKQGEIINAL